jgi:hypothetical protein
VGIDVIGALLGQACLFMILPRSLQKSAGDR